MWDAVVVGGGAAGFFGAITCAGELAGARVLILEKSKHVLSKVKVSGGGRCNVTHHCFEPKLMATHYPRGHKSLIGPLHRFGVAETVQWFGERGLLLKTEADGRMFPVSDDSQTVIDCLQDAAWSAGVHIKTSTGVKSIVVKAGASSPVFEIGLDEGKPLLARKVLLATGGTRVGAGEWLARSLGHKLHEGVPSLFTFNINDARLKELSGLSADPVEVRVEGESLVNRGPLLITHRGMSGPAILKLSAWGARELHALDYRFDLIVNWLPGQDVAASFDALRQQGGTRQIFAHSPFDTIPRRLWQSLVEAARVPSGCTWSELRREAKSALVDQLSRARFTVSGKSTNKDEFVTCGGVLTDEADMRTMESRRCPGVYFAGELLDIDGVTGGFNFQNAWTTGHLAGMALAKALEAERLPE
ncbi:MAG: NAD(P)/FAD-dependent oxidoreductase [Bradymonadaceae bacterium]|nr:NAD(P)/FAD-dependent oxidoreductase [Lujinxingiaceae bacterium]